MGYITNYINNARKIAAALGEPLFQSHSSNPRANAQANLARLTHYVDTATLRWHKSRILSARAMLGGDFFLILESVALDPDNNRRGYRAVVFDLTGRTVYRPDLDECRRSSRAALADMDRWLAGFDPVAHYADAFNARIRQFQREIDALETVAAELLAQPEAA